MSTLLVGLLGGAILSWAIAHVYYRKASTEVPEWAKPIVANLPQERPTREKLLELFQEAMDTGVAKPDTAFGHVACPGCHSPFEQVQQTWHNLENGGAAVFADCPNCGWTAHAEF